jgi:hypothetical protein
MELTSEQKTIKNAFEFHLRELLDKWDAELSVNEEGDKIEVIIHEIKATDRGGFTRPRVEFEKGSFCGRNEGDLD